MKEKILLFIVGFAMWQNTIADVGDFEQAMAFYEQEDYTKVKELWHLLAKEGDIRAQYNMAVLLKNELKVNSEKKLTAFYKKSRVLKGELMTQYILMSRSKGLVDAYSFSLALPERKKTPPILQKNIPIVSDKSYSNALEWLNHQEKSAYTLQLATGKHKDSMKKMQQKVLSGLSQEQSKKIYIQKIEKRVNGKIVAQYILVYGVYKTYQDAQDGVKNLPEQINKSTLWIRQLGVIQSIVNTKPEKIKS